MARSPIDNGFNIYLIVWNMCNHRVYGRLSKCDRILVRKWTHESAIVKTMIIFQTSVPIKKTHIIEQSVNNIVS